MTLSLPPVGEPVVHGAPPPEDAGEPKPRGDAEEEPAVRPLEEIEREKILAALAHFDGNRTHAAAALGIGLRTLGVKLKKWKEQNLVEAGV